MIIAFSPEQAHEVSRAFDAPWFMSDSLYPTYIHKEDSSKTQEQDNTSNEEKKPPAKASKKANPTNANSCPIYNKNKSIFHPCRNYQRAARCARKAFNQQEMSMFKIVEQRTPIHYDEETPKVAKMSLDVTGFAPEDIAINVEDFVVSINGERTNRLGDRFVLDRRFRLDKNTVNVDGVTASIDDGILELTVPKKSNVGPRTIPISISLSSADDNASTSTKEASDSHEEDNEHTESEDGTSQEEPSDNKEENEKDSIDVETVEEEETTNHQQVANDAQSIGIKQDEEEAQAIDINTDSVTTKTPEDDAWEEVLE